MILKMDEWSDVSPETHAIHTADPDIKQFVRDGLLKVHGYTTIWNDALPPGSTYILENPERDDDGVPV